jgi:hypothetical protein
MFQDNRCLPQAGSGYFLSCYFSDTVQAVNVCRMLAARFEKDGKTVKKSA